MPDPTPPGPRSADPPPTGPTLPRGLRGWLRRRAEATLHKPGRALPKLTEPGQSHVVLQLVGAKPIRVITVIRGATGLDLMSASRLAQDAPVVVVSGISEASAGRVVEQLEKAGAKAVAGEAYRPE
jgi:ribosomal protein L7/L12